MTALAKPQPGEPLGVHLLRAPRPKDMAYLHRRLGRGFDLSAGPRLPDPASFRVLVAGRPEVEHLRASPRLDTLIVPFAGLPEVLGERLREFPHVSVHNLHHNADATAEAAVGLMLAAAKGLVSADRALRAGDWRPRYEPDRGLVLSGRTAVIVGVGAIGARVALTCQALGMRVLGVGRRSAAAATANARDAQPANSAEGASNPAGAPQRALPQLERHDLDAVLPEAEVLILCCPLTPETRGLIDARRLALLPRGAVLVNVGRGGLIDEQALYESLLSGQVGAAGLDVWWNYPEDAAARAATLPCSHPLHELDQVVLSPHRAGHGRGVEHARMNALARSLTALRDGTLTPHPVDLTRGY